MNYSNIILMSQCVRISQKRRHVMQNDKNDWFHKTGKHTQINTKKDLILNDSYLNNLETLDNLLFADSKTRSNNVLFRLSMKMDLSKKTNFQNRHTKYAVELKCPEFNDTILQKLFIVNFQYRLFNYHQKISECEIDKFLIKMNLKYQTNPNEQDIKKDLKKQFVINSICKTVHDHQICLEFKEVLKTSILKYTNKQLDSDEDIIKMLNYINEPNPSKPMYENNSKNIQLLSLFDISKHILHIRIENNRTKQARFSVKRVGVQFSKCIPVIRNIPEVNLYTLNQLYRHYKKQLEIDEYILDKTLVRLQVCNNIDLQDIDLKISDLNHINKAFKTIIEKDLRVEQIYKTSELELIQIVNDDNQLKARLITSAQISNYFKCEYLDESIKLRIYSLEVLYPIMFASRGLDIELLNNLTNILRKKHNLQEIQITIDPDLPQSHYDITTQENKDYNNDKNDLSFSNIDHDNKTDLNDRKPNNPIIIEENNNSMLFDEQDDLSDDE